MSDTITAPEAQTVAPKVSVGLATKVGYILGIIASILSGVVVAIEGLPENTSEASIIVTLIVAAAGAFIRTNDGRMKQAAAAVAAQPSQAVVDEDAISDHEVDEIPIEDLPTDDEELGTNEFTPEPETAIHPDVPR